MKISQLQPLSQIPSAASLATEPCAKTLWETENEANARSAVRAVQAMRFTDDRRAYEGDEDDRYANRIHICACCGEEWTDLDVSESHGRFVPTRRWNVEEKKMENVCHQCGRIDEAVKHLIQKVEVKAIQKEEQTKLEASDQWRSDRMAGLLMNLEEEV